MIFESGFNSLLAACVLIESWLAESGIQNFRGIYMHQACIERLLLYHMYVVAMQLL